MESNRYSIRLSSGGSDDGGGESDDSLNKVTYKATKLWLDTLDTFRKGVQLGKHRERLRLYDRCFVAQEVVTWFNSELQNKFDVAITRNQTLRLLQKFYKAGVFTEVTNQSTNKLISIKETDFKANKRLYKLVDQHNFNESRDSHVQKDSNATKCESGGNSDYYVVIKQLSLDQIYKIWEQSFVERFVQIVGYDVFTSFLKPGAVNGYWMFHNITKIGPNGIALLENPSDELPIWIMNAMKCISRWSDVKNESQFPNYPGFEVDVFGLVSDYFNSFKDTAPLLTFELHDAFIMTFVRATLYDVNSRLYTAKTGIQQNMKIHHKTRLSDRRRFVQEVYPFSTSDSVENLLLDIFTPSPKNAFRSTYESRGSHVKKPILPRRILGSKENYSDLHDSKDNSGIEPMPEKSYDIKKYTHQTLSSSQLTSDKPVFLETAFTSARSPVTRIISSAEIECSLGALRPRKLKIDGKVSSQEMLAYENPILQLSPADLINHPKYCKLLRGGDLTSMTKSFSNTSFEDFLKNSKEGVQSSEPEELTRSLDQQLLSNTSRPPLYRPYRSQSAANLSDKNRDRCPYAPSRTVHFGQGVPVQESILSQYTTSPSRSAQKTIKMFYGSKVATPGLMNSEGKEFAILSFRLLTLLLPPKNRRYLQLLLRFMSKVAGNQKLMLDVGNTTRAIVINEFTRAILSCSVQNEYDEFLALQIVTFMMDNNLEIFDVTKEDILKKSAEAQITEQQIEKIHVDGLGQVNDKENKGCSGSTFVCSQRVSLDEYDNQRLLGATSQSLRDLLNAWDALEDVKERKKRLKNFRKEYPHIFAEKFGDDPTGFESSTEKEKKKPRGILRSFF